MPRRAFQGLGLCMDALAELPRTVLWQGAVGRLMLSGVRRHPLIRLARNGDIDVSPRNNGTQPYHLTLLVAV